MKKPRSPPRKNSYGRNYRRLAKEVRKRNQGKCQICGFFPSQEAHHGARDYPDDKDLTPDDLIGVCSLCHGLATTLRQMFRQAERFNLLSQLKDKIQKCYTELNFRDTNLECSNTPSRSVSTKNTLGRWKKTPLQRNAERTDPNKMNPTCNVSNARVVSGGKKSIVR